MKDKYLKPTPIIITAISLVVLIVLLVQTSRRQVPFIPTPPPAASDIAPLSDIPTPQSDAAADTSTTSPQTATVCYAVTNSTGTASLQITTTDGHNATGSLSESLPNQPKLNGALNGTLTAGSDGSSVVFNGSYIDAMSIGNGTPESISITENQATVGSVNLPRVDCAQ